MVMLELWQQFTSFLWVIHLGQTSNAAWILPHFVGCLALCVCLVEEVKQIFPGRHIVLRYSTIH